MKTVPILFTFDQSLEMPAGVCMTSLLENADSDTFYDIFVLHGPQCDFSKSRLNQLPGIYGNCRITFRVVDGEFVGSYEIRGIPETAYYRLISPELIPEYDKYLYSDVDVVFREDLAKYYDLDLGNNYFAAVDTCSAIRPWTQNYLKTKLNLDWRNGYYYSGNLVINAKKLLMDKKLVEFRKLGKNNYLQQDMDIMNIACNGHFMPLPVVFCFTNYFYVFANTRREEFAEQVGEENILAALDHGTVHYNGAKPWNVACLNMDIWWNYYRRSIFFDEKFCLGFWQKQSELLTNLSLGKRIKLLLRYPLDRKQ